MGKKFVGRDNRIYTSYDSMGGGSKTYNDQGQRVGSSERNRDGSYDHRDANGHVIGHSKLNKDGTYSTVNYAQEMRRIENGVKFVKGLGARRQAHIAQYGVGSFRGMAVAAFVLALANLLLGWTVVVPVLSIIFAIVSLVGYDARVHRGRVLAIIAIPLSVVALLLDLIAGAGLLYSLMN
jgi:hypothetical protein